MPPSLSPSEKPQDGIDWLKCYAAFGAGYAVTYFLMSCGIQMTEDISVAENLRVAWNSDIPDFGGGITSAGVLTWEVTKKIKRSLSAKN